MNKIYTDKMFSYTIASLKVPLGIDFETSQLLWKKVGQYLGL